VLDYLFLSRGQFEVEETLEMPYSQRRQQRGTEVAQQPTSVPAQEFPAAPNAVFPSDHLAVGAKLTLTL